MWRLSGIHRSVTLLAKPSAAFIADYAVRTPLTFSASDPAARGSGIGGGGGDGTSSGGVAQGPELTAAALEVDVYLTLAGGPDAAKGLRLRAALYGATPRVYLA